MKRKQLFLIFSLILSFNLYGGEKESFIALFNEANEAYNNNDFKNALATYKKVAGGYESAELYYNMGNACFKLKDIPSAILYYEKALKLDPTDEDIRFNLKMANMKTVDRIESFPELATTRWWNAMVYSATMDTWGWLCIKSLFLGFLFLAGFFFVQPLSYKKILFYLSVLALSGSLITFIFGQQQKSTLVNSKEAIVFSPTLTVKSSPSESSTKLFIIHEGTKVKVLESVNEWGKISLANGNIGWVKTETLEMI